MVSSLKDGLSLGFISCLGVFQDFVYLDVERNCLLKDAVEKMIEKGALLSSLNTPLHIPSFKMETAKIIQESLDQGQWMTSIDLPDA